MSLECRIYPHKTVYVPTEQFMSSEHCLFPWSTVYVPRVEFMFPECSLSPKNTFNEPERILCCHSPVYVPTDSLCPI